MDADYERLELKKQELLQQVAEIEVQQQRQDGLFNKVPHFDEIEGAGRELGQLLSQLTQARMANEVAAEVGSQSACPTCGKTCPVSTEKWIVTGLDGPVKFLEPKAHCSACRRDFIPQRETRWDRTGASQGKMLPTVPKRSFKSGPLR